MDRRALFSAAGATSGSWLRKASAAFAAASAAAAALGRGESPLRGRPPGAQRPDDDQRFSAAAPLASVSGPIDVDSWAGPDDGPWTAQRLRHTLITHLQGERVIVAANREPRIHDWTDDAQMIMRHPASGLVTALEPVMRACSGVWVAHGSGSADRAAADAEGQLTVSTGRDSYLLRRIWLSDEEERGYYYGFSNEALWPLCHLAHTRPVFRRADWEAYCRVNARFAEAVAAEADRDDPVVLVQDYHLALVPKLLRERLPKATIITFWHIPWPNTERLAICPYDDALLDGLLGSSLVAFQTLAHCRHFCGSVDRHLEARVDPDNMAVAYRQHTTLVRAYPISIEWPNHWATAAPPVDDCRRSVRRELDLAPDTPFVLSVDRLDYTKGIEERLLTFEQMLERGTPAAFVQVATPSRTRVDRYRELGDRVRAEVARINARFSRAGAGPIVLLDHHLEPPDVFRYSRAADVCYVSSLHDGMNLVAKEFIAARDDERGVLVLSRFAGAAHELGDAIVVNPYDLDGVADVLEAALTMSADEQRSRMRALRAVVAERNIYRWAGHMLIDAARLRRRDHARVRPLWVRRSS
jgi:trehalose 6-phosphate synthase